MSEIVETRSADGTVVLRTVQSEIKPDPEAVNRLEQVDEILNDYFGRVGASIPLAEKVSTIIRRAEYNAETRARYLHQNEDLRAALIHIREVLGQINGQTKFTDFEIMIRDIMKTIDDAPTSPTRLL